MFPPMADPPSAVAAVSSLAERMRHDLLEVRERALHSLAFKLDNGLLRHADAGRSEPLLRALLEWFNFQDTGARDAEVLLVLRTIATEDPTAVGRLISLGAERFLRELAGNMRCVARRRPPTRRQNFSARRASTAFFEFLAEENVPPSSAPRSVVV